MMKYALMLVVAMLFVLAPAAQAQSNELQQLIAEVKRLKQDVLKIQIELQENKVAQAEQELKKVQNEKLQTEQQEQGLQSRLAMLDERLKLPNLAAEEQDQINKLKTQMQTHNAGRLNGRKVELAQQEAEKNDKLQQEQKRLAELTIAARQMTEK